jgi:microcystin degradation protein MlrC
MYAACVRNVHEQCYVNAQCTFTPARQTLEAFEANGLLMGDELFDIPRVGVGESGTAALGGFLAVSEGYAGRAELVPLIKANGGAGPTIDGGTHRDLVQRMLQALRAAGPLDALFLSLHGAASADGEDDVEGALLEKVRNIVGPDLLIVSPCDHHANITARMVQHADALVGHETQ